ncbi:MAG: CHAD domain-containing protein, partial [bacterium]
ALHELRKDCKKLRYVIEFGESLHTKKEINRAIKIVKGLQNVLGEYQDLFAHVALFESTKRQMFDAGILDAKTAKAIDKIIARLTSSQKEVRRQFNDQYARFASNANQQLFTELFRT